METKKPIENGGEQLKFDCLQLLVSLDSLADTAEDTARMEELSGNIVKQSNLEGQAAAYRHARAMLNDRNTNDRLIVSGERKVKGSTVCRSTASPCDCAS